MVSSSPLFYIYVAHVDCRLHWSDLLIYLSSLWYAVLQFVLCWFVVISPYKFSICDTTGEEFASYSGGGVVCQVKTSKLLTFVSIKLTVDLGGFIVNGNLEILSSMVVIMTPVTCNAMT